MESALNLRKLNAKVSDKYKYETERIVGIIMARYDLEITKSLVNQCYLYWNDNTSEDIDFFWAGYGEYLCPEEESSEKIILKFDGNDKRVYYDRKAFISIKKEFNQVFKNRYCDRLQLILVNYRHGKLHYNEAIKIDLEENLDSDFGTIRELVEFITTECISTKDVRFLAVNLLGEKFKDYIKNQIKGISLSEVISLALGVKKE